jgi:bisphosphoglycerate-independent phosphoglycerate mutase (AlkP superfamily)
MDLQETETLLSSLARIEAALAGLYEKFATNEQFSEPVRQFWGSTMNEELEHAKLFNAIREDLKKNPSIQIEVNFDSDRLRHVIKDFQNLKAEVFKKPLSEQRAYELGVYAEEKLSEFAFTKRISTDNRAIAERIKTVEEDTRRHQILLHNYSLGEKSPVRPPTAPKAPPKTGPST